MSKRSYDILEVSPSSRAAKATDAESCECGTFVVDAAAVARAREALHDESTVLALSDVFSALCDPTRLRILAALGSGELCVCDIAATTGNSQSAVSHQLRLLRDRHLVTFRRDGKRAVYRLADDHVRSLLTQALDHIEEERS